MSKGEKKKGTGPNRKLAKEAAKFGTKFIDNWDNYAKKRLKTIMEMELNYYGNIRPTLKGRSNMPFPVLAKYVDELKGRLDLFPTFHIENHRLSQYNTKKKVKGALDVLKRPTRGDWARKDRMGRNNAIFAGYGAVDFYTEQIEDKFVAHAHPIDHNDFVFEPMEGSDLETHAGVGKFPFFRTKQQLLNSVADGLYDGEQVDKIISKLSVSDYKRSDKYFQGRYERYKAIGLDAEANSYVGQQVLALAELQITHPTDGKRYLVTFDYFTGEWVRFERLNKLHGSDNYTIKLWQTHEDPNVVMCKAPVDDIYPLAENMRVKVNQLNDNHTKRIWGQRAVDPNFFPDPGELEWRRPDQIITGRAHQGKPMSQGVYEFKTEDATTGTIEFLKYMDDFLSSVVGIDPSAVSEETQKVGVMFGQLMKVGSRLGPLNKSYAEMWEKGIHQIICGMKVNMTGSMMVQTIGSRGAEWTEFKAEELEDIDDFEITAESSAVETELNEARKKRRADAIGTIIKDPDLKAEVNKRWLVEEILKTGEWSDNEVRRGMDVKNYGSEEILSRADAAIEEILKGKEPKLYHGADISFFEYVYNFAMDMDDEDEQTQADKTKILAYGRAHMPIVAQNMARRAMAEKALSGLTPDQVTPPGPDAAKTPIPGGGNLPPGKTIPGKGPRRPSPGLKIAPRGPVPPANNMPPRPPIPAAPVAPAAPIPGQQ